MVLTDEVFNNGMLLDAIFANLEDVDLEHVKWVSRLWHDRATRLLREKRFIQATFHRYGAVRDQSDPLGTHLESVKFIYQTVFHFCTYSSHKNDGRTIDSDAVIQKYRDRMPNCNVVKFVSSVILSTRYKIDTCSTFAAMADAFVSVLIPKHPGFELIPFYLSRTEDQQGVADWRFTPDVVPVDNVKGALILFGDRHKILDKHVEQYFMKNLSSVPCVVGATMGDGLCKLSRDKSEGNHCQGFYVVGKHVQMHTFVNTTLTNLKQRMEEFKKTVIDENPKSVKLVRFAFYFGAYSNSEAWVFVTKPERDVFHELFPNVPLYGLQTENVYRKTNRLVPDPDVQDAVEDYWAGMPLLKQWRMKQASAICIISVPATDQ